MNPLQVFFERQGLLILDGGLATELEKAGHDLRHPLWSAKMLLEAPEAIREVHRNYLDAGADCITTTNYQATQIGLFKLGYRIEEAAKIMDLAVKIAVQERQEFMERMPADRLRPLVAASLGPYGAFLADGSEFRGNYGLSSKKLRVFHSPQWALLQNSEADLIACETIPSLREAILLSHLFTSTNNKKGWISFSCKDEGRICDGNPIEKAAIVVEKSENVIAMGINCTAPKHVSNLMLLARKAGLTKPFVIYPNSGEIFEGESRSWTGNPLLGDFVEMAKEWKEIGLAGIGGCCRTGPDHIRALRSALLKI